QVSRFRTGKHPRWDWLRCQLSLHRLSEGVRRDNQPNFPINDVVFLKRTAADEGLRPKRVVVGYGNISRLDRPTLIGETDDPASIVRLENRRNAIAESGHHRLIVQIEIERTLYFPIHEQLELATRRRCHDRPNLCLETRHLELLLDDFIIAVFEG